MKSRLKELWFRVCPRSLPSDRAVILMYHSVSSTDYFFSVPPDTFRAQMAYLKRKGLKVVPLAELVRRKVHGESAGGVVAITFDDGYRDNLTDALPILEEYGFPATVFVTTGALGTTDKRGLARLTREEVRTLDGGGVVSIEPHSVSHPKLATLTPDAARTEIAESKRELEQELGRACTLFAYPYGSYTQETVGIVRDLGFTAAVTVQEGTVGKESDILMLPRVSVDQSTTMAQFTGKVSTAVDLYEKLKLWIS